jgi:hypothetical protein
MKHELIQDELLVTYYDDDGGPIAWAKGRLEKASDVRDWAKLQAMRWWQFRTMKYLEFDRPLPSDPRQVVFLAGWGSEEIDSALTRMPATSHLKTTKGRIAWLRTLDAGYEGMDEDCIIERQAALAHESGAVTLVAEDAKRLANRFFTSINGIREHVTTLVSDPSVMPAIVNELVDEMHRMDLNPWYDDWSPIWVKYRDMWESLVEQQQDLAGWLDRRRDGSVQ